MQERGLVSEPTGCREPAVHGFPVTQGRALEYLGFSDSVRLASRCLPSDSVSEL